MENPSATSSSVFISWEYRFEGVRVVSPPGFWSSRFGRAAGLLLVVSYIVRCASMIVTRRRTKSREYSKLPNKRQNATGRHGEGFKGKFTL